jgi:hypothetical protein
MILNFLDKLANTTQREVRNWYGYIVWISLFVAAIACAFQILWLGVLSIVLIAYSFNYSQDETFGGTYLLAFLLVTSAFFVTKATYIDNASVHTNDMYPAREVSFSDDTKTVHYKVGATEDVRSNEMKDVEYFKNKANFYRDFKEGQTDIRDVECYLNKNTLTYMIADVTVLDKNVTQFECN